MALSYKMGVDIFIVYSYCWVLHLLKRKRRKYTFSEKRFVAVCQHGKKRGVYYDPMHSCSLKWIPNPFLVCSAPPGENILGG